MYEKKMHIHMYTCIHTYALLLLIITRAFSKHSNLVCVVFSPIDYDATLQYMCVFEYSMCVCVLAPECTLCTKLRTVSSLIVHTSKTAVPTNVYAPLPLDWNKHCLISRKHTDTNTFIGTHQQSRKTSSSAWVQKVRFDNSGYKTSLPS